MSMPLKYSRMEMALETIKYLVRTYGYKDEKNYQDASTIVMICDMALREPEKKYPDTEDWR